MAEARCCAVSAAVGRRVSSDRTWPASLTHPENSRDDPMQKILITGAAGDVGSRLTALLRDTYRLRLSDIRRPAGLEADADFVAADLVDRAAVERAVAGVDGIVHLGGFSVEGPWDTILNSNIIGCYNLFEAARLAKVPRVVFASSNHAVGFYPRRRRIGTDVSVRPDSRYGVSTACASPACASAMWPTLQSIGVGWPSGCGPKTSCNWCASVSNTLTSATRYSTASPTTNGLGGTMPRPTVTATGRSFARKIFAMRHSPPRPGCRTTRSVTDTRAGPSAATNIAATRRPRHSLDGAPASAGRSMLRAAAQCA